MVWVEVFAAFGLCHLAGDYMLQTEWQALHKFGGLGQKEYPRSAFRPQPDERGHKGDCVRALPTR
jgi:hypothetical protein